MQQDTNEVKAAIEAVIDADKGNAADTAAGAKKKKPGRPRKATLQVPIAVHGIIDKPANEADLIELIYCDPLVFKKVIGVLKGYQVSEVGLNFDKTGLRIETKNRLGTVDILVTISGACMNLYYCKEPIKIWVKREELERTFGSLGKNHTKVTWLLRENYRQLLYIIAKSSELNSEQIFEVDVFYKQDNGQILQPCIDDDSNYPLKFKIITKYFRKVIITASNNADRLTIQKTGDQPLQLTVNRAKGSGTGWSEVYPDAEKIGLQSNISQNDIFNVSVEFANILPFCKQAPGDNIFVAADKTKRVSLQCFTDRREIGWAICVKIFSNIVAAPSGILVNK